ncbi:transposon Ty3-I Gag-Pol polyprotein [Trichonephila clavipes]|nr:transposon Ty3-I Gag-Pol polyprotein [Trichonephila clavipes]
MHRCSTRRVFSGTGLELVTKPAPIRYLYHSATTAKLPQIGFLMASLGLQYSPRTDLGRVNKEMASPGGRLLQNYCPRANSGSAEGSIQPADKILICRSEGGLFKILEARDFRRKLNFSQNTQTILDLDIIRQTSTPCQRLSQEREETPIAAEARPQLAHVPGYTIAFNDGSSGVHKSSFMEKFPKVDELLSKLVSLEEQLASLKLQRKVRSSSPHHHQRSRSRSKSRRRYNPQGRYCFYHFRFGKKCLLAANSGYLSGQRKPDVNSLWIVEQTSRSSLGQKRKLLIDLHNRKLIDGVTNLSIKGEVATIQENNDLSTVNRASKYFNLLKLYPDLTKPNLVNRVVKHVVKHHILTTGQPVLFEGKTTSPDKLKLAKTRVPIYAGQRHY